MDNNIVCTEVYTGMSPLSCVRKRCAWGKGPMLGVAKALMMALKARRSSPETSTF